MEIESKFLDNNKHMGLKIGSVRRLVGITQLELAQRMHITKQAISKLEQTENIDDERLGKVADALGVSLEGLKKFNTENVLYYTNNFYENCGVSATNGGLLATGKIENLHSFSVEQAMKLFEELLKMEREKFEKVNSEKRRNSKN
ncbi:helix-turn-helix domain-containing protein [Parafilimonas sp.]|uniref:helix-turn-helix domain-containing protein n=1 Tax=Parafilimonas sp. TaxID=1969739 RepID=UPI0039E711E5